MPSRYCPVDRSAYRTGYLRSVTPTPGPSWKREHGDATPAGLNQPTHGLLEPALLLPLISLQLFRSIFSLFSPCTFSTLSPSFDPLPFPFSLSNISLVLVSFPARIRTCDRTGRIGSSRFNQGWIYRDTRSRIWWSLNMMVSYASCGYETRF